MRIGGLVPFTLSDYPGRVAAVIFTQGCNFRCPFCHNGQLIPFAPGPNGLLSVDDVMRFLESRRKRLDGAVISGGEPTIQPDLPAFLRDVKALGYAVKLDTNGSRPDVLRRLFQQGLLDFVAMDVKAPWGQYDRLAGVAVDAAALRASIDLIARSGVAHEFRTTVVPQMLGEADLCDIVRRLPAGSLHRRQVFRREHALASWLRCDTAHAHASETHAPVHEGVLNEY